MTYQDGLLSKGFNNLFKVFDIVINRGKATKLSATAATMAAQREGDSLKPVIGKPGQEAP